jgi:hypothetical protein
MAVNTGAISNRTTRRNCKMATRTTDLLTEEYRLDPEAFWTVCQMRGDDGYDRIEAARSKRWQAIPSWGQDGWDLGSWPIVVIYHRQSAEGFDLAENVEGDATVYRYPTREMRDAATDQLAFWHWKHTGEDWVAGIDSVEEAPHFCGPFSWKRCEGDSK